MLVAFPSDARAEPPPPPSYGDAVQRAYDLIKDASPTDTGPAFAALRVMIDGTGNTQPEILTDLGARPPQYDDARKRLTALLDALSQPADTTDPALAAQRLHEVMAMSRYDALHRPPSILDRIQQWIQDRINDLLRLLFGNRGGAQPPLWWFDAAGIAVLVLIAFLFARAARGRFNQGIALPPS
ncbi:MAG TPA: hypothetical protein VGX27_06555, partial [Candidatus Dormibacteraeota bacterium]|nr:hypothetical protein [Candidatus Dormibacteraeota bacterium]